MYNLPYHHLWDNKTDHGAMVLACLCPAPYSAHAHGRILSTETHIYIIKYDPK